MGGGGLRILGHKKWHVWRRENIERVHRDEREHEEKQLQLHAKQRGIEQERRARTLQSNRATEEASEADDKASVPTEHINFFKQEEQQQLLGEASSPAGDRKRGYKSSRHTQEKLQQETLGRQGHFPWYAKRSTDSGSDDAAGNTNRRDSRGRREQRRKRALEDHDPLKHMRPRRSSSSSPSGDERDGKFDRAKRSRDAEERTERVYKSDFSCFSSAPELPRKDPNDSGSGEPKSKKQKKSKKDTKKQTSKCSSEKESVMQQLRREREEREQRERRRAEALMSGR